MSTSLCMPKAVAVWLVDNTKMTFDQIAHVCGLHTLEVQSIADGESVDGCMVGCDPISTGEMTREEIAKCEENESRMPVVNVVEQRLPDKKKKKAKRGSYTPIARRKAKPDAIMWLLKHSPLSHKQIAALVCTTIPTIKSIEDKTYWNVANLRPRDPVILGLCDAEDFEDALLSAKVAQEKDEIYKRAKILEESNETRDNA